MAKIMKPFMNDDDLCPSIRDIFLKQMVPFTVRQLKKGEILWREKEVHPYCYLIKNGLIKLHCITKEGREKALFYYGKGSLLGFQSLSKEKATMTTATAILPTVVYGVEFSQFYSFVASTPQYLCSLTSYIFHHMAMEAQEIVNISLYTTEERLAALLVLLADEYRENEHDPVLIPFNNDELGAMLGACRNSVSSAVSLFQKRKVILKRKGCLMITDIKGLKEFAQ